MLTVTNNTSLLHFFHYSRDIYKSLKDNNTDFKFEAITNNEIMHDIYTTEVEKIVITYNQKTRILVHLIEK